MKRFGYICFSALLATGCAATQKIAGEPIDFMPLPADAPDVWAASGVEGVAQSADWLSQFDDVQMVALVSEALLANPSLEASAASVRASQATLRSVTGRTRPQVSASGSGGLTSNSFAIPGLAGLGNASITVPGGRERSTDTAFGLSANASWEVDLWGRLKAGIEAAEQDVIATELDLAAVRLAVAAQTAISWINLNEALIQERVAEDTVAARDRIRMLTERRFERGLSRALDVRLARSSLAGAEAAVAARRQVSGNAARALEVLVGRYPADEIDAPAAIAGLAPLEVAGSPLLLLARRPDVAAAETRINAAGFRAEQARLALLPSFQLMASANNNEVDFLDVLDPRRIAANAIASIAQPILDGGTRKAERDAAIARAEIAVAQYADTALTAWREVEDAIAADGFLAEQEQAQMRALEEARFAEDLAERQYTNGLVTIFNLIDAQTNRLSAESNLVTVRANRAINRIRFHQALGGGLPETVQNNTGRAGGSIN